ncbi:Cupredoxin [Jaminaea rosea]|uniref:Cupredoxin n=1 Tax=Jaminaea rosea TaxID=1569628 RepID=A0A316UQZ3_9BASI|nr:Cupredoxin [Jaminaea rosea]PWN26731.1 Cupredoxin [Jaminaea rosea]
MWQGPTLHDLARQSDPPIKAPSYRLNERFDVHAAPRVRHFMFNVTERLARPDGRLRMVYAVNGQMPGPLVEVNEGDRLVLTVNNHLTGNLHNKSISIQWHGLFFNETSASMANPEGVPGLTGCSLLPGQGQTYTIPLEGQAGTFWWHAHVGEQMGGGLSGPIIVHSSRKEAYRRRRDYDSERVLMLQDWDHESDLAVAAASETTHGPQSTLINGRGQFDCTLLPPGHSSPYCLNRLNPRRLFVKRERVRFRIIATASMVVSFDGRHAEMIAADGTDLVRRRMKRLLISAGQRYDVIVDFRQQGPTDFWLRSMLNPACFPSMESAPSRTGLLARTRDRLRVTLPALPATTDWPGPIPWRCADFPDPVLIPVIEKQVPANRDREALGILNARHGLIKMVGTAHDARAATASLSENAHLVGPPVLATTARTGSISEIVDVGRLPLFEVKDDQWAYDLVINNLDKESLSIHLHGPPSHIVRRGSGPISNATAWLSAQPSFDLANPIRRDSLLVPGEEHIVLRLKTDVAGVWAIEARGARHQTSLGALVVHPQQIKKLKLWTEQSQQVCDRNANRLREMKVQREREEKEGEGEQETKRKGKDLRHRDRL